MCVVAREHRLLIGVKPSVPVLDISVTTSPRGDIVTTSNRCS
jgi:hypothetical protein